MIRCGIEPNVISYSSAISACEKEKQWGRTLNVLQEMTDRGIMPDVISYNSAISACEKGKQWEKAVALLQEMTDSGIMPDLISYSSAISACEKGKQWEKALDLLQEMMNRGFKPDAIIYNSTIEACSIPGKYLNALSLVRQARKSGTCPIFATRDSPVWDLHERALFVGCMLIANLLLEVLKQEVSSQEVSFETSVVVTGKGLRSGTEGFHLRTIVSNFLCKTFGLEISRSEKNEGAFLLTHLSLQKWVDSDAVEKLESRFTREVGRQSLSDRADD